MSLRSIRCAALFTSLVVVGAAASFGCSGAGGEGEGQGGAAAPADPSGGEASGDAGAGAHATGDGGEVGQKGDGIDEAAIAALPPSTGGTDDDADGIDDAFEEALAKIYAPVVKLSPHESAMPANVDWYLQRVKLGFSHSHGAISVPGGSLVGATVCPDHVLMTSGLTETNISAARHPTDDSSCKHTTTTWLSSDKHPDWFLSPNDSSTYAGAPASEWKAYVHVKKSVVDTAGGFDVQYWFFYGYNPTPSGINHEADWEHVTITTDAHGRFSSAWYAQHNSGKRYAAADLSWVRKSHPITCPGEGTHADYPHAGTYDTPTPYKDHAYEDGASWDVETSFVDVGELGHPRNGQAWIEFGGSWGKLGPTIDGVDTQTSGPPTPSVQGAWNKY